MPLIPKKNIQKNAKAKDNKHLQQDERRLKNKSSAFQAKADEVRKRYRKALNALASR